MKRQGDEITQRRKKGGTTIEIEWDSRKHIKKQTFFLGEKYRRYTGWNKKNGRDSSFGWKMWKKLI